ncbi:MAG: alpha/beta hydrolase [Caldilineaceae bacterium]|nr:alpha/beta hydrolase [Caldilineaceae bacterium]
MTFADDALVQFEAEGAAPLPVAKVEGNAEHDGARLWYATYGSGFPVILLHGGLGHSGNWGYQVPALVDAGYQVVLIDSRGHGRSTRDERPFRYDLMASDVAAVMDTLQLERAAFVGWSDGAVIALSLAMDAPSRVAGLLFFGCNVDESGTKEFVFTPTLGRCLTRHQKDYAQLSSTPDQFQQLMDDVSAMQQTQPNYTAEQLARVSVTVTVVHSEHDEFIKREHAEYLATTIPNADFVYLPEVSHFAPLQRPGLFNQTILAFLDRLDT